MGEPFKPDLKAHELPRETLVDLWRRTAQAHELLSETWSAAVAQKYGEDVADAVALRGWPLRKSGATPKELFFDDLRFIVAATELKPDMLTVAKQDQAETPWSSRATAPGFSCSSPLRDYWAPGHGPGTASLTGWAAQAECGDWRAAKGSTSASRCS